MLFNTAQFYAKRLVDFADARRVSGAFTETAPFVGIASAGLNATGAGPICWEAYAAGATDWMYRYFGHERAVAAARTAMAEYIALLDADIAGIENGLGDWMALEPKALPLTGRVCQLLSYRAYANASRVTGHTAAATEYKQRAAALAVMINSRFLDNRTGVYASGKWNATQTGQAAPLFFGVTPDVVRAKTLDVLRAAMVHPGPGGGGAPRLLGGMFGIHWVLMALSDGGHVATAVESVLRETFPSFGWMLANNATTLWEGWNAGYNVLSHNHEMVGGGCASGSLRWC